MCFGQQKPDSGLERSAFTPLTQKQNLRWEEKEELLGLRLEAVHTDILTGHSWLLISPLQAAGSPLAPAYCSLPKLVKMSHSMGKQVGLMEPTEVSLLRKPFKGMQELLTDGKSWKLIKMFQREKGEDGG